MILLARRALGRPAPWKLSHAMIAMLATVMVPFALGCAALLVLHWRDELHEREDVLRVAAGSLAQQVDRHLGNAVAQLEVITALPGFEVGDLEQVERYLQAIAASRPGVLISIIDARGQLRFSSSALPGRPLPNIHAMDAARREVAWHGQMLPQSTLGLFNEVFSSGRSAYSGLFFSLGARQPAIAVAAPVFLEGRVSHVVAMSMPVSGLAPLVGALPVPPQTQVLLVDRAGRVVASNAEARVPVGLHLPLPAALSGARSAFVQGQVGNADQLTSAWERGGSRLHAVVRQSRSRLLMDAGTEFWGWELLLVATLALSVIASLAMSRQFTAQLRALARSARKGRINRLAPSGLLEIDLLARALWRGAHSERVRHGEHLRRIAAEQRQEAMRAAQERMRRVFDSLHVRVAVLDRAGLVLDLNESSLRASGFSRDQLVGCPFVDCPWWVADPVLREQASNALVRAQSGEQVRFDVAVRRRSGREITFDMQLSPMLDEHGRVEQIIACAVDVDARVRAGREKDAFIATLAHELRNPLAPIRSAVEIMRRLDIGQPAVQRARDVIDRQARHMTHLVDDLLDVSRVTRGLIRLREEPVDLSQVVASAVETCQPSLEPAGLSLELRLASQPLCLRGDATRLAQALSNLLANAVKFTPRGGRIRLSVCEVQGQALIEVADNGIGLSPDSLERIFEPFMQVHASGMDGHAGLGIGLALARHLVRLHGGDLTAASTGIGEGSVFTLRLPLLPLARQEIRNCRAELVS